MKPIFIVAGEKGSGKTTFLLNLLRILQKEGHQMGGFVAIHQLQSDSYLIKNIQTNEEILLMQRLAAFDQHPNHFKFFSEGVEVGNEWIKELLSNPPGIVVVDEIGRFELAGELWSSSFTKLVASSVPLIFTTKIKYLEDVVKKWKMNPTLTFHADDFSMPQHAFERMKKFL
ncbi:MAG TPA: nucleoside-triphosphatase [Marinilabiliaceae bacterium]|nr:nucleoside-triphosphatase [Marinilabiliaceae bacterium]